MSTIKSQVTCSLCNLKIDEIKWQSHIASTNPLQKYRVLQYELTTKFFKTIFDIRPELQEIYNLESEKTHDFWQLYISPKVPKEKFGTICGGSFDKLETENSLSNNFNNFISEITPFIGKNYFSSMKNIKF